METNEQLTSHLPGAETGVISDMCEDTGPLLKFRGTLECEAPNNRLNDFDGAVTIDGHKYSLTAQQVINSIFSL